MIIEQFEDKNLAHYSYAIFSDGEIALIDPARNPEPYYNFAKAHNAKITSVIETHPHADFVSSHLEIHNYTSATIYVSKLVGAEYPHQTFDDGDEISIGKIKLKAINTPGHSPDSISILAVDEQEVEQAVFTGDTLFIGDCGRPDLREEAGAITASRSQLAKQMYHSLRDKIITLPNHVLVYPAHGAGSLCGKGLSSQNSSTIGAEKIGNWSLQPLSEDDFVNQLLADQPFIPKYFPFNVGINKKGATSFSSAVSLVETRPPFTYAGCDFVLNRDVLIIDTRPQEKFKQSHLQNSINLMDDVKFETWLGSIVNPGEEFYLVAESNEVIEQLLQRIAKIGYESQVKTAFVLNLGDSESPLFNSALLLQNADAFTIIDIRNYSETKSDIIFSNAINIPLHQLRERVAEIPLDKPILVHCAGGYRSAAGASIIASAVSSRQQVFDLSVAVNQFKHKTLA